MKKHLLFTISTILILFGFTILGTSVTSSAKGHTLKFWIQYQPSQVHAEPFKRFIANVEKQTKGSVILKPYWSESLTPSTEAVNGLKSGLLDIAQLGTFMNPGEFPVSDVPGLPFQATSSRGIVEGLRKLYSEGLMPEYTGKGFQLLDFQAPSMQYLMFREKKIDTVSQLKGLRIRSQSPVTVDMIKAFGASPVAVISPDLYMSLDRGLIDGMLTSPDMMAAFKLYEVAKFLYDQPLYGGNMFIGMNQKTWDSLPNDLQNIMMKCVKDWTDDWLETMYTYTNIRSKNILKEKGVIFYQFKHGELEKMKDLTKPVIDKFKKDMDSLGFPGQKIVDVFKSAQIE